MIKSNLPVILLKELTLLPYQEVRIELKSEISKKITKISKLYHDGEVLIVCPLNSLEQNPSASDLPKIGVVGKLKSVIDLPNQNQRVIISGLYRVKVLSYVNYSNEEDILESIITQIDNNIESEIDQTAYFRKLIEEVENYINKNPFTTNSIMSQIKGTTSLDKLTDIVANFLPLSFEKKLNLMLDLSPISRSKTLIKEIAVENAVIDLENKIEEEVKKGLDDSQKEFLLKEKIKILQGELGEANSKDEEIENLKNKVEKNKFPERIKNKLYKEIRNLALLPDTSQETGAIRNYIEYLLSIPWFKETKDEKDLKKIENKLNKSHYGMEDIKSRIIEYIAVKTLSKEISSPIICLVGAPGVGKTTFAESISKALGRKFVKMSLGGMSDSADLIGHRRTYLGAFPGKIITSLIKCESKNPVFLLDEVDKLKKDYKGDPASTLLDILDIAQNKRFVDNYIDEEVDLSKVLFILTANDISDIPAALLDRLEIININGYTDEEKLLIANEYIIPNIYHSASLKPSSIKFEKNAILKIITEYTNESGVRDLERNINKIIRKIITEHIKSKRKINNIKITEEEVPLYLKREIFKAENKNKSVLPGVVSAVASAKNAGLIIDIETTSFPGTGKLILTGSIGKITKESIDVAVSYIKSNADAFKIKKGFFEENDLHIHFSQTALSKDGPSSGIAIVTSILSHIKNKKIDESLSLTGEISLKGTITGVGSIKEKIIACKRNNIKTLYVPADNSSDLLWIENSLKENIQIIPVKNYKEIYKTLFK